MFLAIQQGYYLKAIDCIESAADVNICDGDGKTALIRCALLKEEQKAVGLTRALLTSGAKVSQRDKQGLNALHYSCASGLPLLVDVLLAALDCDVNVRCRKTGNTALHFSVVAGCEEVSRKLVNHVVRYRLNIDVQNRAGETALALALKLSHNGIVKLLVNNGASLKLISNVQKVPKSTAEQRNTQSARPLGKRAKRDPHKLKISKSAPASAKSRNKSVMASSVQIEKPIRMVRMSQPEAKMSVQSSWREVFPVIWSKYTQQNSASFRRPADLEQGEEIYKLLAEQADLLVTEEFNLNAMAAGRRRNSSMPYLGPPMSRRGSLFQAAKAPPTHFEQMRSRRQSVAV